MYIEWLFFFIPIWVVSAAHVIYFDYKREYFSIPNVILAIIMGPILMLLIIDDKLKTKKRLKELEERENNDRIRRWFQTMGLINRNGIPDYGRTIPPPPRISRVEQAQLERERAIRSVLERVEPPNRRLNNKITDFKFLRG
jgi:hypothetical protein